MVLFPLRSGLFASGRSDVKILFALRLLLNTTTKKLNTNILQTKRKPINSAVVGEEPTEAGSTAVPETPAREGLVRDTAGRETILSGCSRKLGAIERGEAVGILPVEVGPEMGLPDKQGRDGESGAYPRRECSGGSGLPSSRLMGSEHPAVPPF